MSVLKEQSEKQQQRHHQLDDSTKRLSSDQANEAPPPIMDTPLDVMGRPSLLELAAKEKEVRTNILCCTVLLLQAIPLHSAYTENLVAPLLLLTHH